MKTIFFLLALAALAAWIGLYVATIGLSIAAVVILIGDIMATWPDPGRDMQSFDEFN